jgi:hypothetical protein
MPKGERAATALVSAAGMEIKQSNPVELIWWGLHKAVSRNHGCEDLSELVEFAERYLKERQPFHPKLGADYEQLEKSPP